MKSGRKTMAWRTSAGSGARRRRRSTARTAGRTWSAGAPRPRPPPSSVTAGTTPPARDDGAQRIGGRRRRLRELPCRGRRGAPLAPHSDADDKDGGDCLRVGVRGLEVRSTMWCLIYGYGRSRTPRRARTTAASNRV